MARSMGWRIAEPADLEERMRTGTVNDDGSSFRQGVTGG
jgi:hypothetical protein